MQKKQIALIKETRQSHIIKKIMEAIASNLSIKSTDRVAIKILLAGTKEIYANTHYETVDSLISFLRDQLGVSSISIVEGADGALAAGKSTWDILYKFKYKEVELRGVKLVNLDELPHNLRFQVKTITGIQEIFYTKPEADYLISVVPPKTHHLSTVALNIANMSGFVKPDQRTLIYGASANEFKRINLFQSEKFYSLSQFCHQNLAALAKEVIPNLSIVDGLYGMEGRGPIKGSPVFHGFAIASEDSIQTDALTTFVMGFNSSDVPYLENCAGLGLGSIEWGSVVGVDPYMVKFPYRPHPLFQRLRKNRFQSNSNRNQSETSHNSKRITRR